MACNCNKATAKATLYKWTSTSGETKTFTSKDAAILQTARSGGSWTQVSG